MHITSLCFKILLSLLPFLLVETRADASCNKIDTLKIGKISLLTEAHSNRVLHFEDGDDGTLYIYNQDSSDSLIFIRNKLNPKYGKIYIYKDDALYAIYSINSNVSYYRIKGVSCSDNAFYDYQGEFIDYSNSGCVCGTGKVYLLSQKDNIEVFPFGEWIINNKDATISDTVYYKKPVSLSFLCYDTPMLSVNTEETQITYRYELDENSGRLKYFFEERGDLLLFYFNSSFNMVLSHGKLFKEYVDIENMLRLKIPFSGFLSMYYPNGSLKARGKVLLSASPEMDFMKIGKWNYFSANKLILEESYETPESYSVDPKLNYLQYDSPLPPYGIEYTVNPVTNELESLIYYIDSVPEVQYYFEKDGYTRIERLGRSCKPNSAVEESNYGEKVFVNNQGLPENKGLILIKR